MTCPRVADFIDGIDDVVLIETNIIAKLAKGIAIRKWVLVIRFPVIGLLV